MDYEIFCEGAKIDLYDEEGYERELTELEDRCCRMHGFEIKVENKTLIVDSEINSSGYTVWNCETPGFIIGDEEGGDIHTGEMIWLILKAITDPDKFKLLNKRFIIEEY